MVEFLCRAGDLESGSGTASGEAMLEGARMHRKIQKEAGPDYQAEVSLAVLVPVSLHDVPAEAGEETDTADGPAYDPAETAEVLLEGRADGLFYGPDPAFPIGGDAWTVDEIKTSYGRVDRMKEPVPVHLAQARLYAWILMTQRNLETIRVRMLYVCLTDESRKAFTEELDREVLCAWADGLLEEYAVWVRRMLVWQAQRDVSLRALEFPYAYRPGQRELAVHVYHTLCHGRKLFLEAPTGTGKTLAVLYPCLKAMAEGKTDRLFYLTARTVTRIVAADALRLLRQGGLRARSVILTARDRICILDRPDCDPAVCPRARGHYDRVNAALAALLESAEDYDRESILAAAEEYEVCPFELALDLSMFADIVICDYNHVFDPRAKLRRFFGDGPGAGSGALGRILRDRDGEETEDAEGQKSARKEPGPVLLIDEAHNLVDRGRSMFSASLYLADIKEVRKAIRSVRPALWKKLGSLGTGLRALSADAAEETTGEGREEYAAAGDLPAFDILQDRAYLVYAECEKILAEERTRRAADTGGAPLQGEARDKFLPFYFNLRHYLAMYEEMDACYVPYCTGHGENAAVHLYCVDPSRQLRECMERAVSTILFSATLLPVTYYKALLGGTQEDYEVFARSVFDSRRQGLFIADNVSTVYKDRGPQTYREIAGMIRDITSRRHGNYMVFFPSYAFLGAVRDALEEAWPEEEGCTRLYQEPQMSPEERESFLRAFEEVRDDASLTGFCVMGGIFSEGIDLREDRLIGVIVVGTGLPGICAEREIVRDHFDREEAGGFDYAYRYPGMNKVLQAAGRVIRTEQDVGIVVLMDRRFLTPAYLRLFPPSWRDWERVNADNAGDRITRFWDEWL